MPDDLAEEGETALAFTRPQAVQGQAERNFYVLKSDIAKHGAAFGGNMCSVVFRGPQSSVRHSDKCTHRIMEEVGTDDEGIMRRTLLDRHAPKRPAQEFAGGGCAAPAVAAPSAVARTIGGAPRECTAPKRTVGQCSASGGRSECAWELAISTSASEELQVMCQWEKPRTSRTSMRHLVESADNMCRVSNRVVLSSPDSTRHRRARRTGNLLEIASIQLRGAFWHKGCNTDENDLESIAAMQVELGPAKDWETWRHSASTNRIRFRLGFIVKSCTAETR